MKTKELALFQQAVDSTLKAHRSVCNTSNIMITLSSVLLGVVILCSSAYDFEMLIPSGIMLFGGAFLFCLCIAFGVSLHLQERVFYTKIHDLPGSADKKKFPQAMGMLQTLFPQMPKYFGPCFKGQLFSFVLGIALLAGLFCSQAFIMLYDAVIMLFKN